MRKPRTSAQQAADVIEHVLSTGAENYLDTAEPLYSWWQLALVDVYAAVVLGVLALLGFLLSAVWLLIRCCRSMARGLRGARMKAKTT